jgi:hypothetical protein
VVTWCRIVQSPSRVVSLVVYLLSPHHQRCSSIPSCRKHRAERIDTERSLSLLSACSNLSVDGAESMSAIDRLRDLRRQSNGITGSPAADTNFSDPHARDKVRLTKGVERDFAHFSFHNSTADSNGSPRRIIPNDHSRDYSMDYRGGDVSDSNNFFPRSPSESSHGLSKHFRDFSMPGVETTLESVEMPRGAGKERGTPEVFPNRRI